MFINLSNHSSQRWEEEQLNAAKKLGGDITDIAFPNIMPASTSFEVDALANQYLEKVLELQPNAVMVQGEMTFVFSFVKKLQQAGIPAYAATTERISVENPDGSKTSVFKFVQFRQYI